MTVTARSSLVLRRGLLQAANTILFVTLALRGCSLGCHLICTWSKRCIDFCASVVVELLHHAQPHSVEGIEAVRGKHRSAAVKVNATCTNDTEVKGGRLDGLMDAQCVGEKVQTA